MVDSLNDIGHDSPKFYFSGAFEEGDTDHSNPNGPDVKLFSGQENRNSAQAELDVFNIPGFGEGDTILAGLQAEEEYNIDGMATYHRVNNETNLPTNPIGSEGTKQYKQDTLAEYCILLESLAHQSQGKGYRVLDYMRGTPKDTDSNGEYDDLEPRDLDPVASNSYGIMVEEIEWEFTAGSPFDIEWRLAGRIADGEDVFTTPDRSDYVSNEKSSRTTSYNSDSLEGPNGGTADLGHVETKRVTREVPVSTFSIALGGVLENIGLVSGGTTRKLYVTGFVTDNDLSNDTLDGITPTVEKFAQYISENWLGKNNKVIYTDAFTDRKFTGQLDSFDTSWETGQRRKLDYSLEFVVGETIG